MLVIRPGAIGDTIVSLPALEYLCSQAEYSEVWVSTPCVPLIRFATTVRSISSTGLDSLELGLDTPVRASLASFDRIVSWYGSNREQFRAAVSGLPVVFHRALPLEGNALPATKFYLDQVGAPLEGVPRVRIDSMLTRDFIACHPFSGSPRKNWPLQQYQQLAAESRTPFEFCVGPEDPGFPAAHRFATLDDVACWLASARVYVGNDSGITHLAAAIAIPVLAIFRCTDPAVWAPRGIGPVEILIEPSVSQVLEQLVRIEKVWERSSDG